MWNSSDFRSLAFLLALAALASDVRAQEVTIAPRFEEAGNFHKGVAPVLLNNRWGLINRSGTWVVQPRYAKMKRGGDGLFGVQDEGGWSFINAEGQTVITQKYEDAEPFENGSAPVKINARWGYIRTNGSTEVPFMFLEIGGREGAYVSARDNEGWAVFKLQENDSPKRKPLEDARRAYSISDSTVIVQRLDGDSILMIGPASYEEAGFDVTPLFGFDTKYLSIRRMSEWLAPAATAPNKWGYLHMGSSEFLWPGRFQDAQSFAQGFAPVKLRDKWGYIDRAGRVAVEPAYDAAFPFRGDYAVIRTGQKRGFLRLDPQGGISVFIAPRYDDAFRFTEGLAPVKIGDRWGYISDGRPWKELVDTGIDDIRPQ